MQQIQGQKVQGLTRQSVQLAGFNESAIVVARLRGGDTCEHSQTGRK